jgi:hypothetical protein
VGEQIIRWSISGHSSSASRFTAGTAEEQPACFVVRVTTGSNSPAFISRMSRADTQRPSCSRASALQAAWFGAWKGYSGSPQGEAIGELLQDPEKAWYWLWLAAPKNAGVLFSGWWPCLSDLQNKNGANLFLELIGLLLRDFSWTRFEW